MSQEEIPLPASPRPDALTDSVSGGLYELKIDTISLLLVLFRHKKTVLRYAGVALFLSVILVFFVIKPLYTAEAVFIPPQTSPGSAMSQLAGQLGSLGVAGGLMGLKTPADIYLGILQSRTVADDIIARFNLQEVYKAKKISRAEKMLQANAKFVAGKNTLIRITVDDDDPNRAAAIANGFLDELQSQNGRLALTEASQRRLFFEQQLDKEKNALADAEVELRKTQESTGLIVPTGQMQLEIGTIANIRAQITSREIQLASLRQGATDQNPEVVRIQTEIGQLHQQLQRLQDNSQKSSPGNTEVPTAKVPALALEYIRKQREVKYHEMLFESLAKQYEMARLDESREAPLLQVVDRAIVPDTKSGPHRLLLMIAFTLFGAVIGSVVVFLRYYVSLMKQNSDTAERLRSLSEAISFR
jgi:capsule polysaccharide export protein KpsE/RkpR